MSNNEPINYGRHYWYVRVTKDIAENEEQYVQADEAQIKDGVLLFLQDTDPVSYTQLTLPTNDQV